MLEHSQRSVKGAATIALYDIEVSAVSGKSLSDTNLFSLLLSDGLKLFVVVFQFENQYKPLCGTQTCDGGDVCVRLTHQSSDVHLMKYLGWRGLFCLCVLGL